jgi:hypothetical protein
LGGEAMAERCEVVIEGISNPLVVLLISNAALELGVAVPIPTLWACMKCVVKAASNKNRVRFI